MRRAKKSAQTRWRWRVTVRAYPPQRNGSSHVRAFDPIDSLIPRSPHTFFPPFFFASTATPQRVRPSKQRDAERGSRPTTEVPHNTLRVVLNRGRTLERCCSSSARCRLGYVHDTADAGVARAPQRDTVAARCGRCENRVGMQTARQRMQDSERAEAAVTNAHRRALHARPRRRRPQTTEERVECVERRGGAAVPGRSGRAATPPSPSVVNGALVASTAVAHPRVHPPVTAVRPECARPSRRVRAQREHARAVRVPRSKRRVWKGDIPRGDLARRRTREKHDALAEGEEA